VEQDPFWDAPRNRLYFVRNGDIWYADRSGTTWLTPVKLGDHINSFGGLEQSPCVTQDGQKLYYVSSSREGFLWDIWVSTWNSSTNDWGTPVNIGGPVNTPGDEFSCKLSPDGERLYFSSNTSIPYTRCGFYVSQWTGSNWTSPQEVFVPGGECGLIEYPAITANGEWFYFRQSVHDGASSFVSHWNGSTWELAADLRPQIGERSGTPFVTPSGDSLLISSGALPGGFGGRDVWLMVRLDPTKVSTLNKKMALLLIFLITLIGVGLLRKSPIDSLEKTQETEGRAFMT
jgi:Tol biopolymer transport system component